MISRFKRWWRGPTAMEAWQFHPDRPEVRIRTWPVRFENEERFRSFVDDVMCRPSNWTREAENFKCTFNSPAMGQRHVDTLDEFLKGRSPSALRSVTLIAQNPDQGVKIRRLAFSVEGVKTRGQVKRNRDQFFVSYGVYQGENELMDVTEQGTELEREIDLHTVPMNRWSRFRQRPVVERYRLETIEERQRDIKIKFYAWGGSVLLSLATTVVTLLIAG